jgi:peptidoglycan-associated lipoprotein
MNVMRRMTVSESAGLALMLSALLTVACGGNKPPVARPTPPPPPPSSDSAALGRPPAPPEPVEEPTVVPPEPIVEDDAIASGSLDDLNRSAPLKPVFFDLDSAELSADGQKVLDENAQVLKKYTAWTVTIEGHCDERGSAEYNLALGERRALAARAYLVSLGLSADRLRTVSYGKEFPFDPGHEESAFSKNRRAHFVITAK